MIAGHTKFSPDGFFSLIKLKMRNSEVQSLSDLVQVVSDSTILLEDLIQLKQYMIQMEFKKFIFINRLNF